MSIVMTKEPDSDVADAIEMTDLCMALHCLPREGGLLDQDSMDVWKMKLVLQARHESAERNRSTTP